MGYYHETELKISIQEAYAKLKSALKNEGFGIVSEIDLQAKFKEKLGKDYKPYLILGVCNPGYAYEVIHTDDNLGLMLPCNFVIQEGEKGTTRISVIDPVAAMMAVNLPELEETAKGVRETLFKVLDALT